MDEHEDECECECEDEHQCSGMILFFIFDTKFRVRWGHILVRVQNLKFDMIYDI